MIRVLRSPQDQSCSGAAVSMDRTIYAVIMSGLAAGARHNRPPTNKNRLPSGSLFIEVELHNQKTRPAVT